MHDEKILELLFARAERSIEELRKRFGSGLLGLAMRILGNLQDAEEAVNDTYLAVWDAIPPARPDHLTPFIYKVGRNAALKKLRNRSAQKRNSGYELSLEELADILPGDTLEEQLDAKALGQAINRFLDTLSCGDRVLFVRRYWFGDSVTELAQQQLTSPSNLSVRLHRIRQKLKDYLNKEGFFL